MMRKSVWIRRKLVTSALLVALGTFFSGVSSAFGDDFRTLNGADNNETSPTFGEAETELLRLAPNAYADGISEPTGGFTSSLPSARAISNGLSAQSSSVPNSVGASDWVWQWGQFLDHDIDLTGNAAVAEPFNISVPAGDPSFDPTGTGAATISLNRSISTSGSAGAPREQINEITSFIDGSNVYGSNDVHADGLRDLTSRGLLRTSAGNMLPFNTTGLANDNGPNGLVPSEAFVAGDVRANEQIGLTSTHALFLREHNRLATELAARLDSNDTVLVAKRDAAISAVGNGVNNEADFLYHSARKVVGAQIQKVTYEEFLPILLGNSSPSASSASYDASVDAGISNEFSTAAFRVGHTLLSSELQLVDPTSGANIGSVALKDSFFTPSFFQTNSIENVIAGLASQDAQEVDTLVIDDVRNFLFGPPGSGGFDLASLNIQRGRDHGLSDINSTRAVLGLSTYDDYIDLTGGDQDLANALEAVFGLGNVDDVDLWIGGLAEVHIGGGLVGETFSAILGDQFERSRDGDRFFYEFEFDHLLDLDSAFESTQLSDIILRNTDIVSIQSNVFLTAAAIAEPSSSCLLAAFSLGYLVRRRR